MGRPKNGLVGAGVDSLAFGDDTTLATAPAGFGEETTFGLGRNDVAFTLSLLFPEAVVGERGIVPPAGLVDLVTFPLEVEPVGAPLEIAVPVILGVLTVVFALPEPPLKGGMS